MTSGTTARILSTQWCYMNGRIMPADEATVSVMDIGMLRGFGVYDGITVINGEPLRLKDHIIRFRESGAGLGMIVPESDEQIHAAYARLAELMNVARFNTRMIMTGGVTQEGLSYDPSAATFYILAEPFTPLPAELYESGGSLMSHEFQRQYAQFKTINYISAVMTYKKRLRTNAAEVLFTHGGRVLECATSNIFIVKAGKLLTPDSGILRGITRKMTVELMSADHEIIETSVSIDDMLSADEIFITSSFKDIVPITSIDGQQLFEAAGPITRKVIERYGVATGLA